MAKLRFSHATLTKHFAAHPKSIAFDETRGLGAYKTGKGISLFVQYRCPNGVQRKKTLALLSEIAISDARTLATKYVLSARHGDDLVAAQKVRETPKLTLGHAFAEYTSALKRKGASPATLRLNDKNYRLYLSKHGARELSSFTKAEVRSLHSSWRPHGPVAANAVGRLLRTLFNYSIKKLTDEALTNPCIGIEWFPQKNVRKTITDLPAFATAVSRLDNPIRTGFWRAALLTGLRKNDLCTMRWADVSEDRVRIPHPKMGRPFDLPITEPLREVLAELREHGRIMYSNSPWVFPSNARSRHLENPHDKALSEISPHQCRRYYATTAAHVLNNPFMVAALLNHKVGGVTAAYVQPDWEQRRGAAIKVANFIEAAIGRELARQDSTVLEPA